MSWYICTKKQYKIWVSANPNCFLPALNKLRFIRTVLANPSTHFSFVYSSAALTNEALEELITFCDKLQITPIDINTTLTECLTDEQDKLCYQIALKEIENALAKHGGNLAAVSDCLQTLPRLIELAGIYSDFDVEVNFETLPKLYEVRAPVIIPITLKLDKSGIKAFSVNNEFLAAASSDDKGDQLDGKALLRLKNLQLELILRYQQPLKALVSPVIKGLAPTLCGNEKALTVVENLLAKSKQPWSVFQIRQYFEKINQDSLRQTHDIFVDPPAAQLVKKALYQASVTHISGPLIYLALFAQELKNFDFFEARLPNNMHKMRPFIECLSTSGLAPNELDSLVLGQDRPEKNKRQVLSDVSWTPDGAKALECRSMEITRHVVNMQKLIRLKQKDNSRAKKLDKLPSP